MTDVFVDKLSLVTLDHSDMERSSSTGQLLRTAFLPSPPSVINGKYSLTDYNAKLYIHTLSTT